MAAHACAQIEMYSRSSVLWLTCLGLALLLFMFILGRNRHGRVGAQVGMERAASGPGGESTAQLVSKPPTSERRTAEPSADTKDSAKQGVETGPGTWAWSERNLASNIYPGDDEVDYIVNAILRLHFFDEQSQQSVILDLRAPNLDDLSATSVFEWLPKDPLNEALQLRVEQLAAEHVLIVEAARQHLKSSLEAATTAYWRTVRHPRWRVGEPPIIDPRRNARKRGQYWFFTTMGDLYWNVGVDFDSADYPILDDAISAVKAEVKEGFVRDLRELVASVK